MKNNYLKTTVSLLIVGTFLFLAFGCSYSGDKELSKVTEKEIIKALTKKELNDESDISGGHGIGVVTISLMMNPDKTFQYVLEENYNDGINRTTSSITASGTYDLMGTVTKVDNPSGRDKYGNIMTSFSYQQKIKFNGTTNKGGNFTLIGKLMQDGDDSGLSNKWFFTTDDGAGYSSNIQEEIGVNNYRLPHDFIYP